MICPGCNQNRAHRSHRSGIKEWVGALLHYHPYRCHACNKRFFAYRHGETSPKLRSGEERKIIRLRRQLKWKRTKRELLAYGFVTIIIVIVIYYLTQQTIPQS